MSAEIDQTLTSAELAARLKVKPETPSVWRKRRVGPRYIKVGRSVRYEESAVRQWLDEGGRTDVRY